MEEQKSRGRLRFWRNGKYRNRDRSRSVSPPKNSHLELENSTLHDIKEEEDIVAAAEGVTRIENADFSSLSKRRGSMKIWNLKEFFLCSRHRSGSSEKVGGERLPISSYAKLCSSPLSNKEKAQRASVEEKLGQKKTMDKKTVYLASPNRKGVLVSAHELHYIANRAQAEELRKKTIIPYRQGVLACLSFPSSSTQGHMLQPLY